MHYLGEPLSNDMLSIIIALLGIWGMVHSPAEKALMPSAAIDSQRLVPVNGLSDYWYQGKAEITRYTLSQNRYRDLHDGEAVLVFVTEDFLTDKQVKNEYYENPNSTGVLKMNYLRKFPTGIYDYSIMTSVFTPTETENFPHTLKITSSSQEWCGQSYLQFNKEMDYYRATLHSYFEKEADTVQQVDLALTEDELFNRIRIAPTDLPTGEVEIIPGTGYTLLMHKPMQPYLATLTLEAYTGDTFSGDDLKAYRVEFPGLDRTLEIVFEAQAPYIIEGWTDTYPSVMDGEKRTTIARRTKTIQSAYWEKNSKGDQNLRAELGMERW